MISGRPKQFVNVVDKPLGKGKTEVGLSCRIAALPHVKAFL